MHLGWVEAGLGELGMGTIRAGSQKEIENIQRAFEVVQLTVFVGVC